MLLWFLAAMKHSVDLQTNWLNHFMLSHCINLSFTFILQTKNSWRRSWLTAAISSLIQPWVQPHTAPQILGFVCFFLSEADLPFSEEPQLLTSNHLRCSGRWHERSCAGDAVRLPASQMDAQVPHYWRKPLQGRLRSRRRNVRSQDPARSRTGPLPSEFLPFFFSRS